jgi:small subunit ribosomal protein S6
MMRKYEAMFIVKPDLAEEEKKALFNQIGEAVVKNQGSVTQASVWSERRKMCFPIKKYDEGTYYLMNFSLLIPSAITEIKQAYKLNENIIRVLILQAE